MQAHPSHSHCLQTQLPQLDHWLHSILCEDAKVEQEAEAASIQAEASWRMRGSTILHTYVQAFDEHGTPAPSPLAWAHECPVAVCHQCVRKFKQCCSEIPTETQWAPAPTTPTHAQQTQDTKLGCHHHMLYSTMSLGRHGHNACFQEWSGKQRLPQPQPEGLLPPCSSTGRRFCKLQPTAAMQVHRRILLLGPIK